MRRCTPPAPGVARVLVVLVVCVLLEPSRAYVRPVLYQNDERTSIHIDTFGFFENGGVKIEFYELEVAVKGATNLTDLEVGLFMLQDFPYVEGRHGLDGIPGCDLQTHMTEQDPLSKLLTSEDFAGGAGRQPPAPIEWQISIRAPYHLFFFVCAKSDPGAAILSTLSAKVSMWNTIDGKKTFLPAGWMQTPSMYLWLCVAFAGLFAAWLVVLSRSPKHVKRIHWLMTAVLVFKVGVLFFESLKLSTEQQTGHTEAWTILLHAFRFLKGIGFFAVIVLVGTGWSYLRPFLTNRDKKIIWAVFSLQIVVNLARVLLDEWDPGHPGYMTWQDILHVVDMICCVVILFPIVWSIRHLQESSRVDGKATANMQRLRRFQKFYLLVVAFIYFTRIVIFLLRLILPFDMAWLPLLLKEFADFAFFAVTGFLFRPQDVNPYIPLEMNDLDDLDELDDLDREFDEIDAEDI